MDPIITEPAYQGDQHQVAASGISPQTSFAPRQHIERESAYSKVTQKSGSRGPVKNPSNLGDSSKSQVSQPTENYLPAPPSYPGLRIAEFHRYSGTSRQKTLELLRVDPDGLKKSLKQWIE